MPRRKKADALLVNLSSEQQRFVDDALEGKNILVDALHREWKDDCDPAVVQCISFR